MEGSEVASAVLSLPGEVGTKGWRCLCWVFLQEVAEDKVSQVHVMQFALLLEKLLSKMLETRSVSGFGVSCILEYLCRLWSPKALDSTRVFQFQIFRVGMLK